MRRISQGVVCEDSIDDPDPTSGDGQLETTFILRHENVKQV